MRKGYFCITFMLLVLLLPGYLRADLGEFKQDVEREEAENREEDATLREEEEEGGGNPFLGFLWEITVLLWSSHNGMVYYGMYPYAGHAAGEGSFISYDYSTLSYTTDADPGYGSRNRKTHWFELTAGGMLSDGMDTGGSASLQGRFFPFLGPDIDYRVLFDNGDMLHMIGAGLDLSLVQNDWFSLSFYGKGSFFRGILDRSGMSGGFTLRSFPFRPVSLYLRGGGVFFEYITFGQLEGRLNFHLDRYLLYGGANLLQSESARLLTVDAGGGVMF